MGRLTASMTKERRETYVTFLLVGWRRKGSKLLNGSNPSACLRSGTARPQPPADGCSRLLQQSSRLPYLGMGTNGVSILDGWLRVVAASHKYETAGLEPEDLIDLRQG